jgi:hypothetical protein
LFLGTFDGNALVAASSRMADALDALPAPVDRTRRALRASRVEAAHRAGEHEVAIARVQRHVREHMS